MSGFMDRDLPRLLRSAEVAEGLKVPLKTLYQWRYKRTGPPSFRLAGKLRYDAEKLRIWLDNQARVAK